MVPKKETLNNDLVERGTIQQAFWGIDISAKREDRTSNKRDEEDEDSLESRP